MLSYIQQWMIYAAAAALLAVSVFAGAQTLRLNSSKKDLIISQKETDIQRSKTETMATTMKQMAIISDSLAFNYSKAQEDAQRSIREHKKIAETLAAQIVPRECSAALEWAVSQALVLEEGW